MTSALLGGLLDDLAAESADLDARVAPLPDDGWRTPTPAVGWDIRDTVTHLAATDGAALTAATEPEVFAATLGRVAAEESDWVEHTVREGRARPPTELLAGWREGRGRLAAALRDLDLSTRLPWFGPPMGLPSFVTARLMETWAHGQDVVDALGQTRPATARLRSVADLGVRARRFSYAVHGRALPDSPVRVELTGPDGETWEWGPADATDRVGGPALDFCLLVTQRRHRSDLAVHAEGPAAQEWLGIAQAFAGPPGGGREPLAARA